MGRKVEKSSAVNFFLKCLKKAERLVLPQRGTLCAVSFNFVTRKGRPRYRMCIDQYNVLPEVHRSWKWSGTKNIPKISPTSFIMMVSDDMYSYVPILISMVQMCSLSTHHHREVAGRGSFV